MRTATRPSFRLDGDVALVTGAGSGTGRAIAIEFAQAGAEVILMARTADSLQLVADEISAFGGHAIICVCDVTNSPAVRAAIDRLPRLDILVNNAGTNIPAPFVDVTELQLDALVNLNMRATFVVAQAAVKKMLERVDGGVVINVTSQMGHVGSPHRTAYCMTKHGVEGLTKSIAVELAPSNIRVISIAPTFVDTPLIRRIVGTPQARENLVSCIPLGCMATEGDIAAGSLYLASCAAAMVTGSSLMVDGGWTAQ